MQRFSFLISFLLLSAGWLINPAPAFCEETCPFGLVEDPAPGQCGLYEDKGRDAICDYSQTAVPESQSAEVPSIKLKQYPFFAVLLPLLGLYFLTWFSAKSAIITRVTHRIFWNILLLFFFLISGVLGIILILRINYSILADPPFNLLYWHVEAGLAMAIVSVFHLVWHLSYYHCAFMNLFKKKNSQKCP